MATDNVGGMTDAPIDRWEWCGLMDAYINVPDGDYVRHADYIAERDALRQWRVDMCERLGFDCAAGAQWTTEDIASELRRDELKLIADRDRHAARCEVLEAALRLFQKAGVGNSTDFYTQMQAFNATVAALSPPASDAADSTHGETK